MYLSELALSILIIVALTVTCAVPIFLLVHLLLDLKGKKLW